MKGHKNVQSPSKVGITLLAIAAALSLATGAWAGVTQVNQSAIGSEVAFPVSGTDLINQGQPTFVSQVSNYSSPYGSVANLNDGVPGVNSADVSATAFQPGGFTSTFNLNTNAATGGSATGYDLSRIDTFAGWTDNGADQKYQVLVSQVGSPTVFTSLGTFTFAPFVNAPGSQNSSTEISLTAAKGPLASDVGAVRFIFQTPTPVAGDDTYYREIDVSGKASSPVPEASSAVSMGLLLALGLGGAVAARKRCRA